VKALEQRAEWNGVSNAPNLPYVARKSKLLLISTHLLDNAEWNRRDMAAIQWYPGHMSKASRQLAESLKLVDVAIEILDARIPQSSRNPDLDRMLGGKRRIVVLNKEDLADPKASAEWKEYFSADGRHVVFANSKSGAGLSGIRQSLRQISLEKIAARAASGVVRRPARAMVAGIPNSGKSTLINMLAGKPVAKTEDRPGVTRARQWVRLEGGAELLDTPGVLWPKFGSEETAYNLAFTGAIKDAIMDITDIAERLLAILQARYPAELEKRYGADCLAAMAGLPAAFEPSGERMGVDGGRAESGGSHPGGWHRDGDALPGHGRQDSDEPPGGRRRSVSRLDAVGKRRGFLLRGGEIDLARTATIVLDEFRAGKIGRVTLEIPKGHAPE
jgi:ribosome biogenesis GTPase A